MLQIFLVRAIMICANAVERTTHMTAGSYVSWADGREPVQANGEFDQKQAEKRASPGGLCGFGPRTGRV